MKTTLIYLTLSIIIILIFFAWRINIQKSNRNTQLKDLKKLEDKAKKVHVNELVFEEKIGKDITLLKITNKKEIKEFISCLEYNESTEPYYLRTIGKYSFSFFDNANTEIGKIDLLEYRHIRWENYWNGDKELKSQKLLKWLSKQGIEKPLNGYKDEQEERLKKEKEYKRIMNITPKSLYGNSFDIQSINNSLIKEFPLEKVRIRKLFKVYGAHKTSWTQFSVLEVRIFRVLDYQDLETLLNSINLDEMDEDMIDGISRFFLTNGPKMYEERDLSTFPKNILLEMEKRKRKHLKK